MNDVLVDAALRARRYLDGLGERPVFPSPAALTAMQRLGGPLQVDAMAPEQVLEELDRIGSPATVATAGGRYFGFVVGGSLPSTVATGILAAAWDQNAGLEAISPLANEVEKICRDWLVSLLGFPPGTEVGFVSGATSANFAGLCAARHAVLQAAGWDVEADGLFGAPPITVIVGDEVHVSVTKALGLAGLGRTRVHRVPVDGQGRMLAAQLPRVSGPTIVCIQAGNVNTGAFDPAAEIAARLEGTGAWIHVDGAFGLWAAAAPSLRHLMHGFERADSWATDAHKWLNVPYSSGLVLIREPRHLMAAMAASAAYLLKGEAREHLGPEMSQRARAIQVWSALRSLGTRGLASLVETCCAHARRFARALEGAGYEVLNEVVSNQVLVSFGTPEETRRVIAGIQEDGTCWCGGTEWQGRTAMRISVSSWATTEEDVDRSLAAMLRIAGAVRGTSPAHSAGPEACARA